MYSAMIKTVPFRSLLLLLVVVVVAFIYSAILPLELTHYARM